jgi:hypothetical protein
MKRTIVLAVLLAGVLAGCGKILSTQIDLRSTAEPACAR